jgi:hypothetical protein
MKRLSIVGLQLFILALLQPVTVAAANVWSFTGSMSTGRIHQSVVALADGRILTAGGRNISGTILNSAELYDPYTGSWAPTANTMGAPRESGVAVRLQNGTVLFAGGISNGYLATTSAELFDPASGMFSPIAATMTTAREGASGTLLPDGHVLIVGGDNYTCCAVTSAELYDPSSQTFSATGSTVTPHRNPAVLLQNGKVLTVGCGGGGTGCDLSESEVYDPASKIWTRTGNLIDPRGGGEGLVVLENGKALLAGGSDFSGATADAELFDPATQTWTETGSLNVPRYNFGLESHGDLILLSDGKVLVAGGRGADGLALNSAELYDPVTGIWSLTGNLNVGRADGRSVAIGGSKAMIFGGFDGAGGGYYSSAEILDVVSDQSITFTSTPPSPAVLAGSYTPSATGGGSGNPVVFSVDPATTACALSGGVVSFNAIGGCTIDANQAGSGGFNPAPQAQQSFAIVYAPGGTCNGDAGHTILQPINADGSSVFKAGSTVPAKFRVCNALGVSIGTAGVVASFRLVQTVSGTTVNVVNEAVTSNTPDASFRWDSGAQQWIFNISTKGQSAGFTYYYVITLNDGTTISFHYGLR